MTHSYLSLGKSLAWESEAARRGVSAVARSGRGFLRAYEAAGSARALSPEWRAKREGFIARHMAQAASEPWFDANGRPTRRHLALIMWAYSPQPSKLRKDNPTMGILTVSELRAAAKSNPVSKDQEDLDELKDTLLRLARTQSAPYIFTYRKIESRTHLSLSRIKALVRKYPEAVASWLGGIGIEESKGRVGGGMNIDAPFKPSRSGSPAKYRPESFMIVAAKSNPVSRGRNAPLTPKQRRALRLVAALREVQAVWRQIHSRPPTASVAAATANTRKVSAALRKALDAGATDTQIHEAMDDGYTARRRCRFRLRQPHQPHRRLPESNPIKLNPAALFDGDAEQDEGWFWIFEGKDIDIDSQSHVGWAIEKFEEFLPADDPDEMDMLAIELALQHGAIRVAGWKDFQVWLLTTSRLREMQAHMRRNWTRDAIAMHHVTIDAVMETWVTLPARDFLRARDEDDVWAFRQV